MKFTKVFISVVSTLLLATTLHAQVTTGSITGYVRSKSNTPIKGAAIEAVHTPSGTLYSGVSQQNGAFQINGLRIGGPYSIIISAPNEKDLKFDDIYLQLGTPYQLDASFGVEEKEVVVSSTTGSKRGKLISTDRKGASTNIGRATLERLPTLSRSITDFTKLTPQSNGTSFAGMDNRFNNLTIDGSIFNNSFGLQALPGSQTNSTPISLDAIEEIQINLSPYSLKEGRFTGAGINAITRSGTNTLQGSFFYNRRNESFVGKNAGANKIVVNDFNVGQMGFRLGGPIIKNKAFFFINGETENRTDPGTTFVANDNNGTNDANETRVLKSDLEALSAYLKTNFNYNTGAYQGYSLATKSYKALAKFDYNINKRSKLSTRLNYLRSFRDVPVSNSGGFSGRRDNLFGMAYQNSNYIINNDIYSGIVELNTNVNNKLSNNILAGFTANRDYRSSNSSIFPLVDILNGGRNYITFGYEPFTPNNRLNTNTIQFADNITYRAANRTISAGVNFEALKFENTFTPLVYGRFAFNSLADFYTAANAYLANNNLTVSPVSMPQYNLSYSTIPGSSIWQAKTKANMAGAYIQSDEKWDDNFNVTYGVRFDVPFFGNTGYKNDSVDTYKFLTTNSKPLSTSKLPGAKILISPRFGFNWDVTRKKELQVRGGVGLFAGAPAFVWISNQIGNNGVQSGSINTQNTTAFAFSPNVTRHIPTTLTRPAPSYNIAVTDPDFKYPQVVRGNLAVDHKLPFLDLVASVELMYTAFVNNVAYYNANLEPATSSFNGPDNRPRFPGSGLSGTAQNNANRVIDKIVDAIVLTNTNKGSTTMFTAKLERTMKNNFGFMLAYNYGATFDLMSAGSIAATSFNSIRSINGNNRPELSFSDNDLRNRFIGSLSYRLNWGKIGATTINAVYENSNQGRATYTIAGDMNGDGIIGNEMIYVPKNRDEITFEQWVDNNGTPTITTDDITYTVDQQKDAFWAFVNNDKYLRTRLGKYAERNGLLLPMIGRMDFSITHDFSIKGAKNKHGMQIRMDIFNFGNMLNKEWGVGNVINNLSPLIFRSVNSAGVPVYRMATLNRSLNYSTYRKSTNLGDVWQMQLGLRYTFN